MKICKSNDLVELEDTGLTGQIGEKKTKARIFKAKDFTVYVNEKFLKYFDRPMRYEGSGEHNAVFCYEEDELVAILMPMRK